jgi:hypothetical protein
MWMSSLEPKDPDPADVPPPDLLSAAESIVDGRPVDWDALERSLPDQGELVRELRRIQAISEANRGTSRGHESTEPDDSLGFWGPLQLRGKLGQGTFGEVYRAYDASLDREVALKLLHESSGALESDTRWLLSEAKHLARVRHPNVLVVHGAGVWNGRAGFWTDLLPGSTLEKHLIQKETLDANEVIQIGVDLCRALTAVHQAGIIHRDVKPSNVMRESGGRFVLMDFGSGEDLRSAKAAGAEPRAYGTPLFMAPEQLRGETLGPATDVYALGVLLYRAVSGRVPIEGSDIADLVAKHRAGASIPLRDRRLDIPIALIEVIDRAIRLDPAQRFASPEEMERALVASMTPRRWRAVRVAVPVLGLFALAAVALMSRCGPEPSSGPARHARETGSSAGRITARAELFRQRASGADRLMDGARIEPGDGLYLAFEAPETLYIYVLDEDAGGNFHLLFPVNGVLPPNPLGPSVRHRLPGSIGAGFVNWQVTSAEGEERITVLAFRSRPAELERQVGGLSQAVEGKPIHYGALGEQTLAMLRGISGFTTRQRLPARDRDALSRAMATEPLKRDDSWVWQIHLNNPPP